MPQIVTLIRARFAPESLPKASAIFEQASTLVGKLPGVRSITLWDREGNEDERMVVVHYDSPDAADEGLRVAAESPVMAELTETAIDPPDIRRGVAVEGSGAEPGDMEVGQYLSLSIRDAEPGMGPEFEDELRRIFEELRAIPDFAGSMITRGPSLEEEVTGIALWGRIEGYLQSLPKQIIYEVNAYRRIA